MWCLLQKRKIMGGKQAIKSFEKEEKHIKIHTHITQPRISWNFKINNSRTTRL